MELVNMDLDTQEIINKMSSGNFEAILYGAHSNIPILNLNAIIFGTKYLLKDTDFINIIKSSFLNSNITFFGVEIKKIATASLHLLGVKKYTGEDHFIKELIDSKFNF